MAERSGAETETPDHPLLRDPEPLEEPDEEAEAPEAEDSDMPEPEPEVGPAS